MESPGKAGGLLIGLLGQVFKEVADPQTSSELGALFPVYSLSGIKSWPDIMSINLVEKTSGLLS